LCWLPLSTIAPPCYLEKAVWIFALRVAHGLDATRSKDILDFRATSFAVAKHRGDETVGKNVAVCVDSDF
jgi:hypothetical protein